MKSKQTGAITKVSPGQPAATIPSTIDQENNRKIGRYQGCLLGGAVGDALGAIVEFMSASEIDQRFGATGIRDYVPAYGRLGAITDDTQMTLFTAEGMLRTCVRTNVRGIGASFATMTSHAYLRWLQTQGHVSKALNQEVPQGFLMEHAELFSRRAPGATCISALRAKRNFDDRADNDSKGCGGVMRAAPVGMFTANWMEPGKPDAESITLTFDTGCAIAAITHGHPTGQLTAGVLAVVIALLLNGMTLTDALRQAKNELRKHARHEETLNAIEGAERLAAIKPSPRRIPSQLGAGWVAEEALAIGLYCALAEENFEASIILAVNHSGDSDSTGSIAGNILGAMLSREVIPPRWLAELELRELIETVAVDLATVRDWCNGDELDNCAGTYWNRYPGC